MSLILHNVTLDCDEPKKVAAFWSAALGRPVDPAEGEYFVSIGIADHSQPGWFFIKVPERKQVKNRVHLDLQADDREREVEGNEFCVG